MTSSRSSRTGKDHGPRPVPAPRKTETEYSDKTVGRTIARPWCKDAVLYPYRPVPVHICIHVLPATPGAISAKKYQDWPMGTSFKELFFFWKISILFGKKNRIEMFALKELFFSYEKIVLLKME